MTLAEIKTVIINGTKEDEICDGLYDVQNAETEDDLISAWLPYAVFAYQSGIIDDSLLASFTETNLNAQYIYSTGTFTISDPTDDIYIMKDAVVNLNIIGKCKINAMGACTLNLTTNVNAFATIRGYDSAIVNITMNNASMVNLLTDRTNTVDGSIIQNDTSILQISAFSKTVINLTNNNSSYAGARMHDDSVLNPFTNDSSVLNARSSERAVINYS